MPEANSHNVVPAQPLGHAHISFDSRQLQHILLPGGEKDGMRGLRTYREPRAPSPRPSPPWGEGAIAAPPIEFHRQQEMHACPGAQAGILSRWMLVVARRPNREACWYGS